MSELAAEIAAIRLVDTHEHLAAESEWVEGGPDVLGVLFGGYVPADLYVAGASAEAIGYLQDASAGDVGSRFAGVRDAWEATWHTGYGEAVRIVARELFGLDELTSEGVEQAQERLVALRRPGGMMELLRDRAGLDHVQIDHFRWAPRVEAAEPEFFLYDVSWHAFCDGRIEVEELAAETGIEVRSLADLDAAMAALFERHSQLAIAVKTQHAYSRTLRWEERTSAEAERALQAVLAGKDVDVATRLTLGDWCWARGVEHAIEHNLPLKIHTGYYAGHSRMPVDYIRAGNLCALLARYPRARFVLMHIAYPYNDELVAIAKHYANVWVDFCWAWSIDPYSSTDFLRRCIHAVPSNKLFAFGGDTRWPINSFAYAVQARKWLTRALEAEVAAGDLTEAQAIKLAQRLMHDNQYACFDVERARAAVRERCHSQTAIASETPRPTKV